MIQVRNISFREGNFIQLVVSVHLKNMTVYSQLGSFPQIGMKIREIFETNTQWFPYKPELRYFWRKGISSYNNTLDSAKRLTFSMIVGQVNHDVGLKGDWPAGTFENFKNWQPKRLLNNCRGEMFFETGFGEAYPFSGLFQTSSASCSGGCSTAMTKLRHVLQRNNKLQGLWFVDARDILIILYSAI